MASTNEALPRHGDQAVHTAVLSPEELWELHGESLFALACTVLGDETEAVQATTRGLVDVFRVPEPDPTLRTAARSIHRQCPELPTGVAAEAEPATTRTPLLGRLDGLARQQRSAIALCFFGGHTYREAAAELGIPAEATAGLLVSGLLELGRAPSW